MPQAGIEVPDIGARVYHSASQVIPHIAMTTLAFNSERWDTDTIHDLVINNSRLTCKTAGKYLISASVEWAPNAVGYRQLVLFLNGGINIAMVNPNANAIATTRITISTVYNLAINDYVEVLAYQTSGGNLNINPAGNWTPEFMIQRIG